MIKDGRFREDLFYRLNVLPVYLPPLRERQSDIPHLVEYYIKYFNGVHALQIKGMTPEAMKAVTCFGWPGNIRELRNVIEHAFIIESSDMIALSSLPEAVRKVGGKFIEEDKAATSVIDFNEIKDSVLDRDHTQDDLQHFTVQFAKTGEDKQVTMDFQVAKDLFEKQFFVHALRVNKGKINQTALKANIPKKTLLRKIEKYEIVAKDFNE